MDEQQKGPGDAGGEGAPDGEAPDAERALEAAQKAVGDLQALSDGAATARSATGVAFELPSFNASAPKPPARGLDLLSDVNLNVKIELGRTRMLVEDVLKLGEGAVVELDKLAGDPVDVFVNDRPIARGEILVLNDNFCIRINEIIGSPQDAASKE